MTRHHLQHPRHKKKPKEIGTTHEQESAKPSAIVPDTGTIADGLADSCSWVVPSPLFFFHVSRMLSVVAGHSRLEQ